MPSIILNNMKTVWVTETPWTSPDNKVTIWTIKLEDPQGERGDYATMSKVIATEGWSGDIEMYTNAKGKEYVRQAPKEESGSSAPHEDKQYLKDVSDMPFRVYAAGLPYIDTAGMMKNDDYTRQYLEHVRAVTEELLHMIDGIRSDGKPAKQASLALPEHVPEHTPGVADGNPALRRGLDKHQQLKNVQEVFGNDEPLPEPPDY